MVKKHSLLALGLTAFSKNNEISSSSSSSHRYSAHNFNFTLLPTCSFTIQPSSAAFLVDNGFDFSTLFSRGIRFTPGSCSTTSASSSNATTTTTSNAATPKQHQPSAQQLLQQHEDDLSNQVMRSLFAHIMSLKTPIVLHNGLLDLMFLYYSFHADLPASLDVFLADGKVFF